jgi:hypothetical protein
MPPLGLSSVAQYTSQPRRGEIEWQYAVGVKAPHAFEPSAQPIRPPLGAGSVRLRDTGFDLCRRYRREE